MARARCRCAKALTPLLLPVFFV
eukprot:COSAG05_NODE_2570_length_2887_cov_1.840746_3_plen_22_part_01